MASPTFTSISPSEGNPGGGYLAVIVGTDFEQHPLPATTGYVGGTFDESMRVEINGREATEVRVYTATKLTCLMPAFKGDPDDLTTGLDVDIVLTNLGPPEEDVTEVDGFTYKRTNLARGDSALARVCREVIDDLRRQVIKNIAVNTSVSYDGDTADDLSIIEMASAPGIALLGPFLTENKLHRMTKKPEGEGPTSDEYYKYRTHIYVDVGFDATIVAKDDPIELINLMQLFVVFFRNNTEITLDKDPGDSSQGTVAFEMWLTSFPKRTGGSQNNDLFLAKATFMIQGLPLDEDTWNRVRYGTILDDPADVDLTYSQEG